MIGLDTHVLARNYLADANALHHASYRTCTAMARSILKFERRRLAPQVAARRLNTRYEAWST